MAKEIEGLIRDALLAKVSTKADKEEVGELEVIE
jgi:hypothetical protein